MWSLIKKWLGIHESEPDDPMKYLVVGLGNIGAEYVGTRHNIGFEIADYLAQQFGAEFEIETLGSLTTIKHKGRQIILLKPSTYMNLSGKSVRYWLQKKNIRPENLLVLLDDLNLPFGSVRIRKKGSHGGHNGLKHIEQMLGTQTYARLRFGIGNHYSKGRQVDYVLGPWNEDEMNQLGDLLEHCAQAVLSFSTIGIDRAMSQFNKHAK